MLIWEKLLLHVDGSGDFQWADIWNDQRVEIPRDVSEFRKTENLLRLIVDNAVSHHTTSKLRYLAESLPDRRARDQAVVDTLWANHLNYDQDFNSLFAQALYLAMPAGFCPVHGYWREDTGIDWYEPISYQEDNEGADPFADYEPVRGMIDCFVGNPFGTVFNPGAKLNSVAWCSYERVLSAQEVREHFDWNPEASGVQGTTRIPSAAEFQRIALSWYTWGLGIHGSPVMMDRRDGEELLIVVCREDAPTRAGDPGRLRMIAVPETADLLRDGSDRAILLVDQPLPAGDYSWTNVYSHHRGSDVHGKPWIEDIDQIQVDLNIALSKRWECINRMVEAPIVAPGGAISEDMTNLDGYNLLEVEPSLAAWRPRVMEWPQGVLQALNNEVQERRQAIYTGGGYQAVSRGESPGSRMAYRAILALQQADNTVHGPVNVRFQKAACQFMRRMWMQMKTYGDVDWLIKITSDEYAHLAEPYINNAKLSDTPPLFKLTNAFGPSPELRAQEIIELTQVKGADGKPFLLTEEARRAYPNPMLFDDGNDVRSIQRRRAKTIAVEAQNMARRYREDPGFDDSQMPPQWRWQAYDVVGYQLAFGFQGPDGQLAQPGLEQLFPRFRDDDLAAHIAAYSEVIQDETADPLARAALKHRQEAYYQWQSMMAGPQPTPGAAQPGPSAPDQRGGMDQRQVAAEMAGAPRADESGGPPVITATAR